MGVPRPTVPAEFVAAGEPKFHVAVVIPCYRVTPFVLDVLRKIGPEVSSIIVVDDACPDFSGQMVAKHCRDQRVKVVFNQKNLGVGGATLAGYVAAVQEGAQVIVKIDGDGQMDPALIPQLVAPIVGGVADYTKGNRFYDIEGLRKMPPVRIFGNAVLSLMTKFSAGYWNLTDPTNGFTCIHAGVAKQLPLKKISSRYFFETDLLFRLNLLRAVVKDVPMHAHYGLEKSNLSIKKIVGEFLFKHARNWCKRLLYSYVVRDFTIATVEFVVGAIFISFGMIFGGLKWYEGAHTHALSSSGAVMLAAMPIILGVQMVLAALNQDVASTPTLPIGAPLMAEPTRLLALPKPISRRRVPQVKRSTATVLSSGKQE